MPTLQDVFDAIERVRPALTERHVSRLGVFGSVARGDAGPDSDVDVLVDFTSDGDLFDLAAVRRILTDALGCPVDVVPSGGLKPDVRERVLREVRHAS